MFKKYFEMNLEIKAQDDSSIKRLGSAVAYLVKKLQHKIFEATDSEIIRILSYFKVQLSVFYNYYKNKVID